MGTVRLIPRVCVSAMTATFIATLWQSVSPAWGFATPLGDRRYGAT